ncbi:methyltransferase family protein [Nevskia ramosa]|uniref:methyltransferase family protein n=1 Tax=Nevskia ramosa TaxID=64002 RepID=UPI0023543B8E|nr:methyltransferase [Nevskia ramosa]
MMAELFTFDIWTVSLLIAFATCLLSFNWGMYRFFTEPSGSNSGIDTIKLLGTTLGFISLSGIPLFGIASVLGGLTALLLCAASLALFWWAIRANRTRPLSFAFSEDEPSHLVSTGPYRWIRHPFYSAYLLAWLAVPVATLQPLMLMPLLAMGAIYVSAARVEEKKFDASVLAAAYARYRAQTGMLVPRLRSSAEARMT